MTIEIRNYKDSDLEICRELWVVLTQRHRDMYDDQSIGGEGPGKYFDEHLEKVGAENIWLAEFDGIATGMIGLEENNEGGLVIEPVVVHPDYRNQGIGMTLLEHMKVIARERESKYLSIRPVARNAQAMEQFHRAGFINLGHVEMFIDFSDKENKWKPGMKIHELDCRY